MVPDGLVDRADGVRAAARSVLAIGDVAVEATAQDLGHGALADALSVAVRRWDTNAQQIGQRLTDAAEVLADNVAAWQALDDLLAEGS